MSDIELVIRIPEEIYRYIQAVGSINMLDTQQVANAIFDGQLLPKGYGDLKDADAIKRSMVSYMTDKSKTHEAKYAMSVAKSLVDLETPIIEAYKESED